MGKYINILNEVKRGNYTPLNDISLITDVNNFVVSVLNNKEVSKSDLESIDEVLRISNIAYNNTSNDVLLLDDGVYDQLMVFYQKFNPNYQVGSTPSPIEDNPQNEFIDERVMINHLTDSEYESKIYIEDILKKTSPLNTVPKPRMITHRLEPISKRLINTTHKYPDLVGTLDKCKFVLNSDADSKGVLDNPSVQVFERDFIHKVLDRGLISPTDKFTMIGELKYDGVSVEAEVCGDRIISALSRGDTSDNIATDLTPIFGGYKFPNVNFNTITFGIKFEAVITKYNLELLGKMRGKTYKNARNGVIGILGSSDAYKYTDYITLIPISSSLHFDESSGGRFGELEFLNRFYSSGEYNRYCTFYGNYMEILFQVKQFTESAEIARKVLPYMIDGVVISFVDPSIVKELGRENSVNKYQMAIKFNPRKNRTIFLGYTYNIGKSGDVIPMAHFKPCEFIGGIHTKQTIHSYDRFKELNLSIGDQIDIEYVNDVISYVTKPDTEFNRNHNKQPEEFIKKCPYCGSDIIISESGKSAKCPNVNCHERRIMRMVDMIDRLGFKDFSEETIRTLDITDLNQLFNINYDIASTLGPNLANKLLDYIYTLKANPINDYRLMSALGFDGMADEKWKLILKYFTPYELLSNKNNIAAESEMLRSIPGIGPKIIESIINGMKYYGDDFEVALSQIQNIILSKGHEDKPKVAITGFRDPEFIEILNNNGFDASENYGLTKASYALIAADPNATSGKISKAKKYGIPIFSRDEFISRHNIKL